MTPALDVPPRPVDYDTVVVAGQVAVRVALPGVRVHDFDLLEHHRKRARVVIRLAAGPLDRAGVVGGVAAGPDADADVHGRLGVVLSSDSVGVVQGAYGDVVDEPCCGGGGPGDGVVVRCGLGGADRGPDGAVVGCGVTLDVLALRIKIRLFKKLPLPK